MGIFNAKIFGPLLIISTIACQFGLGQSKHRAMYVARIDSVFNEFWTHSGTAGLSIAITVKDFLPNFTKRESMEDITIDQMLPFRFTGTFLLGNRWGEGTISTIVISEEEGKLLRENPRTETPGQQLFYLGNNTFRNDWYPYDHFKFHLMENKAIACSEYANEVERKKLSR
jgi:hypothetical protein